MCAGPHLSLLPFQFDKYAPKLDSPYFRHSSVSVSVPKGPGACCCARRPWLRAGRWGCGWMGPYLAWPCPCCVGPTSWLQAEGEVGTWASHSIRSPSLTVLPVLPSCHPGTAQPAPTPRPLRVPAGCFSAQGTAAPAGGAGRVGWGFWRECMTTLPNSAHNHPHFPPLYLSSSGCWHQQPWLEWVALRSVCGHRGRGRGSDLGAALGGGGTVQRAHCGSLDGEHSSPWQEAPAWTAASQAVHTTRNLVLTGPSTLQGTQALWDHPHRRGPRPYGAARTTGDPGLKGLPAPQGTWAEEVVCHLSRGEGTL